MATCKAITKLLPAVIAWVLLLTSTVLFFIYPCQFLLNKYHVSLVIFQGVITVFVVSNFFLATFMDPGIIPKASPEEDDGDLRAPLFKSVEVNGIQVRMKWCMTCKFYRPPRCSHCSECDNCIETFDHHCPWLNNCIGRRNYRHFFFFLIFLSIHMLTVFIWCVLYVLNNKERLYETESIVALALMTLIVLLTIPVIGLTIFHIFIVSTGRTTNEQITGKFQNGYNPFTRGFLINWSYTLCGPKFPKSKKHKDFSFETNNLNEVSINDKVVRVYLDNDDKNLIQKSSLSNKTQFLFAKNNQSGRSENSVYKNENGSAKTEKIDLVLESLSRDSEPSPSSTLKSQSTKLNNLQYSNAKPLAYHHYNLPNNQLTSSQSQVLYSQHYPLPFRNNLHSKNIQTNTSNYEKTNEISLHLISKPGSHLINHPSFYHQFNARSSPTKSTSISEITPYVHNNKQLIKSNGNNNAQQSGVVVYYSPEEASNSLMVTDLDSANNKFASSESELQKLHLICNNNTDNRSNNYQQQHQPQTNLNKNRYFFSKQLRPMSFKKALEITEQLDRNSHVPNNTIKVGSKVSNAPNEATNLTVDSNKDDNRHSQYEMNYEISV